MADVEPTFDEVVKLTLSATRGQPFESTGLPDTPAYRVKFERLKQQVAEIAAKGGIVDIPFD